MDLVCKKKWHVPDLKENYNDINNCHCICKNVYNAQCVNGILFPKLFWPTVRKFCSSDREKIWTSRLKAENLQKFWDHYLEEFIRTVKGQTNFWNVMLL